MVGEAVANEAQATLLDVLLYRVKGLLLGDLHLRVSPAGDLNDHVEDTVALVGEKGNVVEGGQDRAILLDVDSMLCLRADQLGAICGMITLTEGVRCADDASREFWTLLVEF